MFKTLPATFKKHQICWWHKHGQTPMSYTFLKIYLGFATGFLQSYLPYRDAIFSQGTVLQTLCIQNCFTMG